MSNVSSYEIAREFCLNHGIHTNRNALNLEKLLKETSRNVRHACAENILSVYTGDERENEIVNACHAKCMNTQV